MQKPGHERSWTEDGGDGKVQDIVMSIVVSVLLLERSVPLSIPLLVLLFWSVLRSGEIELSTEAVSTSLG